MDTLTTNTIGTLHSWSFVTYSEWRNLGNGDVHFGDSGLLPSPTGTSGSQ